MSDVRSAPDAWALRLREGGEKERCGSGTDHPASTWARAQRRRKLQALPPAVVAYYESQKKPWRPGTFAIVIAVAYILLLLLLVFVGH